LDENKVFEAYFELPDGYEVQLMVLRDYPGGRARRGAMSIFRSRVWVGHVTEADPLLHRSQEHPELNVAVDACYSMLLQAAPLAVNSPEAIEYVRRRVHDYFHGLEQVV
jgi:hypothetical protein